MSEKPQAQISVDYLHDEDRLLVQLASDGRNARIWLTRRLMRNVLSSMDQLTGMLKEGRGRSDEDKRAIEAFMQDAAMQRIEREPTSLPEDLVQVPENGPLLAEKISFTPLKDGRIRLVFQNSAGMELPFAFKPNDFRVWLRMISEASEFGEWDLAIPVVTETGETPAVLH